MVCGLGFKDTCLQLVTLLAVFVSSLIHPLFRVREKRVREKVA